MIDDVHYMLDEHHYIGIDIFTTLLHYYVMTEVCDDDVHHKGTYHHYSSFYSTDASSIIYLIFNY